MSYGSQSIEKMPKKTGIKVEREKSFKIDRKAARKGKDFVKYS